MSLKRTEAVDLSDYLTSHGVRCGASQDGNGRAFSAVRWDGASVDCYITAILALEQLWLGYDQCEGEA